MGKQDSKFSDDELFVKYSDSCMAAGANFAAKGAMLGAAFTVVEAQHQIGHMGYAQIIGRGMVRSILPGALAGAVFASTTCLMDDIRGKNYPMSNAFIGGMAAGFVVGSKSHNPWTGFKLGLFFGMAGFIARCFAVDGVMRYDPKAELDYLNKTLYLSEIAHLGPKQQ